MNKVNNQFVILYLVISIFLFAFFTSQSTYMVENIIVPYIRYSPIYIHFGLTVFTVLVILINMKYKRISIDIVFLFLLARIVVSIIPVLYTDEALNTIGRVTIPIIALLAYFIGRQYEGNLSSIIYVNIVFVLILSIQTIYTVTNMVVPNIIYYEQHIKIPLASSNLIAAFITPCIFLILEGYHGKWYIKYTCLLISILAVILSTSKGAILICVIMLIYYKIFLNKNFSNILKILIVFITFMLIVLLFVINIHDLSNFTHQRSDLIISDMRLWTKHILLGNGMVYEGRGAGSHNIMIDLLVQSGIVGFGLYIIPLIMIFKQLYYNKDKNILCLIMYLLVSFLHSLGETSYFTYTNDMLFWFMAGIAISKSFSNNELSNRYNRYLSSCNSKLKNLGIIKAL